MLRITVNISHLLLLYNTNFYQLLKCKNCTLEEQAILNIIRENPTIKQEQIAKTIGKSLRTIKTRMIKMQEKGLIARKNGKRNGKWEIL